MSSYGNDIFDDAAFDEVYYRAGREAGAEHGFLSEPVVNQPVSAVQRSFWLKARIYAAQEYVTDIQQRLIDDDAEVRKTAREGLHLIQKRLYTGHRWDTWKATPEQRLLARVFGDRNPDRAQRWWHSHVRQRQIRISAVIAALVLALVAGLAIAGEHPLVALPLLVAAGLLDVFEGAFARVVQQRSPTIRWVSCVASQAGDLLMIGSIAVSQILLGHVDGGWIVVLAVFASLAGAFVRVSALQAGYRFWLSRGERFARYGAVGLYCVLAAFDLDRTGAGLAAVAVGGYGLFEVVRTLRAVLRGPRLRRVGMIVIGRDDELTEVPFLDGLDQQHSLSRLESVGHTAASTRRNLPTPSSGSDPRKRR